MAGNVDLSLIYELHYTNSIPIERGNISIEKFKIAEYVEPYIYQNSVIHPTTRYCQVSII